MNGHMVRNRLTGKYSNGSVLSGNMRFFHTKEKGKVWKTEKAIVDKLTRLAKSKAWLIANEMFLENPNLKWVDCYKEYENYANYYPDVEFIEIDGDGNIVSIK